MASEPDDPKNTRPSGSGDSSTIISASRAAAAFVNGSNVLYAANAVICAATASRISVRPWPTWQYQRLARASMYSRPDASRTTAPSPPTISTNSDSCLAGSANGCRKGCGAEVLVTSAF